MSTARKKATSRAKSKAKTGLFALLGRLVWMILAKLGLPYAKNKVKETGSSRRR